MIDPKELRIGNLVTDALGDSIIEVDSISAEGINLRASLLACIIYTPISQVFGIQLNHKILTEWFKFKCIGQTYSINTLYLESNLGVYDVYSNSDEYNGWVCVGSVQYVHDLQNALWIYREIQLPEKNTWSLQS